MSQASRLVHTARFGSTDDLSTKPALKTEWEKRNKKFAAEKGPDDADADIATMYAHMLILTTSLLIFFFDIA
jgi:hypothetical protein